jgi:hypothetical protein
MIWVLFRTSVWKEMLGIYVSAHCRLSSMAKLRSYSLLLKGQDLGSLCWAQVTAPHRLPQFNVWHLFKTSTSPQYELINIHVYQVYFLTADFTDHTTLFTPKILESVRVYERDDTGSYTACPLPSIGRRNVLRGLQHSNSKLFVCLFRITIPFLK